MSLEIIYSEKEVTLKIKHLISTYNSSVFIIEIHKFEFLSLLKGGWALIAQGPCFIKRSLFLGYIKQGIKKFQEN